MIKSINATTLDDGSIAVIYGDGNSLTMLVRGKSQNLTTSGYATKLKGPHASPGIVLSLADKAFSRVTVARTDGYAVVNSDIILPPAGSCIAYPHSIIDNQGIIHTVVSEWTPGVRGEPAVYYRRSPGQQTVRIGSLPGTEGKEYRNIACSSDMSGVTFIVAGGPGANPLIFKCGHGGELGASMVHIFPAPRENVTMGTISGNRYAATCWHGDVQSIKVWDLEAGGFGDIVIENIPPRGYDVIPVLAGKWLTFFYPGANWLTDQRGDVVVIDLESGEKETIADIRCHEDCAPWAALGTSGNLHVYYPGTNGDGLTEMVFSGEGGVEPPPADGGDLKALEAQVMGKIATMQKEVAELFANFIKRGE